MSTEIVTAEPVNGQAIASSTLFHTDDPAVVVQRASEIATVLADVIRKQRLSVNIQGREHVKVEGWTLLGTMLGVFPVCSWSRPVMQDGKPVGWEARVEARTMSGTVVGAAEAECTRDEKTWKLRDDYALRSMAQTRATSKALRLPLGFVMTLAGFDPTPADEVPAGGFAKDTDSSEPAAQKQQLGQIASLMKGWLREDAEQFAESVLGHEVLTLKGLTKTEASALIKALQAGAAGAAVPGGSNTERGPDAGAAPARNVEGEESSPGVGGETEPSMQEKAAVSGQGDSGPVDSLPGTPAAAQGRATEPAAAFDPQASDVFPDAGVRPDGAAGVPPAPAAAPPATVNTVLYDRLMVAADAAGKLHETGKVKVGAEFGKAIGVQNGFYEIENLIHGGRAEKAIEWLLANAKKATRPTI